MEPSSYNALVVEEIGKNKFSRQITKTTTDDLPDNDILIRVRYSSLNYKDALSATGNRGVTKTYPHTPGVDAAGVIEHSRVDAFKKGETF